MYKQRLYIFISLCVLAICMCIGRLGYLQFAQRDYYRQEIEKMRILSRRQLPTIRGRILDRNAKVIAADKPVFYLHVGYKLTRLLDDRFWEASILAKLDSEKTREQAELQLRNELEDDFTTLMKIIEKCAMVKNLRREEIEDKVRKINNRIWDQRQFFAWSVNFSDSKLKQEYKKKKMFVPLQKGLEDFQNRLTRNERLELTIKTDISEMHRSYPLIELTDASQLLGAQLEFADTDGIRISPETKRIYPYHSAACQVIGWVGPAQAEDKKLFADDDYSRILAGEVSGRDDGVEKVCEIILRGRRGEVVYDINNEPIDRKPTQFGADVRLSLDIELQRKIETYLSNLNLNPGHNSAIGVVVIDVATGDILSLVSMPVYDLNTVRQKYKEILYSPGAPFSNKAIYELYPPGSAIKPFILIAGMQEGKITPTEVISCPHKKAGQSWPNCWIFNKTGSCHDWQWQNEGGNNARNAIRGSCNIYFSHLADRLEASSLQRWLFEFGFGWQILPGPDFGENPVDTGRSKGTNRNLRQSHGVISSQISPKKPRRIEDVGELKTFEKKLFGIGQGSLSVTVLQVANAMAAVGRGGIYKNPRLFLGETDIFNEQQQVNLGISELTLTTLRDGMSAVVNEYGGTAFAVFNNIALRKRNIKVYGKTGSTEGSVNAWFAGFVEDDTGRAISIALVVEGGESGAKDAAPLGRDIIKICNEAGYIGQSPAGKKSQISASEDK